MARPVGADGDAAMLFAQERRGEGDPIVLLHGFGGDHTAWIGIVQRVGASRATLAYDLPGHGRSLDVPGAGRAGAMAKALLADLDARGIGRAHLVGHSMGGAVATLMAMRAPGRTASLTLVAPGGFGPEIAIDVLHDWGAAVQRPAIARALARMTAPGHVTGAFEIGRVEAMRRRPGQAARLREIADMLADADGRQGEIPREQVEGLSMPVALVWGDADPILPFSQSTSRGATMTVVALEGAGHMLMEERPREVAAALAANMARGEPA